MLNGTSESALRETLELAGVASPGRWKCIDFGKPDGSGNESVRLHANDLLLTLAKENRVGRCVHITGEMRALADPFHRRICSEIRKRTDSKFSLVYDIPEQFRKTPEGLATWNAEKWKGNGWADRLSAFNIIGEDIVDVYAYATLNSIQYSVFGDRFILLQGKHDDLSKTQATEEKKRKMVWLLESEQVHAALCESAEMTKEAAEVIPDSLFKQFSAAVHGVTSREILRRLIDAGGSDLREKIVDDDLHYFDQAAESTLAALKSIEFVRCSAAGGLQITSEGRQYYAETQVRPAAE